MRWPNFGGMRPCNCRQKPRLSNLRVDEDGSWLATDIEPNTGKAFNTARFGRSLAVISESQQTQLGSLIKLLAELQSGNIQTIDDLRSRLEVISQMNYQQIPSTSDLHSEPAAQAAPKAEVATPQQAVHPILELDEAQDSLAKEWWYTNAYAAYAVN